MMLDKELAQIVSELTHISEATATIREVAERKKTELFEINRSLQDDLHLLETDDDMSDDDAAKVAKRIAEKRRTRRELKTFITVSEPFLAFCEKHNETLAAMAAVVGEIQVAETPLYVAKTDEGKSIGLDAAPQGTVWKKPTPVLCKFESGIQCHFSSVAQASRQTGCSRREIYDCCYGNIDNAQGMEFSFIDKALPDSIRSYSDVQQQVKAVEQTFDGPFKKRAVISIDEDGNIIEYESIAAAARAISRTPGAIGSALRKGTHAAGYKWEYLEEEDNN